MLEYDNSAFYYFAITLLVIYLIPSTYFTVKEVVLALGAGDIGSKARTSQEEKKAKLLKSKSTGWTRLNNSTFLTNFFFLLTAWAIFLILLNWVSSDGEVQSFDPFAILKIAQDATSSEIKKAYRKLSLQYHPDKNPGDRVAEETFMKIAKAYEALTDETSKENYEKYGNPDGKQSLEVSIGLPSILLENPKVVLVLYLVAMVVVIPVVVGFWYSNSKQYGENNIMYDTYSAFYQLLEESHRLKNLPEVIAASAECRQINVRDIKNGEKMSPEEKEESEKVLFSLFSKLKNEKLMIRPRQQNNPLVLKGNLLLHAHLLRLDTNLTKNLRENLNAMLVRCGSLVEGVIEIAHQRRFLDTSIAAVKFSQHLVQALWVGSNSLEQLPYMTSEQVKVICKANKQIKSLGEFLRIPDTEKKGLESFTAEQKLEILKVSSLISKIKVETKLYVEEEEKYEDDEDEDEEDKEKKKDKDVVGNEAINDNSIGTETVEPKGDQIFEQDLVTLKVTVTRENLEENQKAGPVYAPNFPSTVFETMWVVLTDKRDPVTNNDVNIYTFEKIQNQDRVITHEVRFMAPQKAGSYSMELQILSDSYIGIDQTIPITFTVNPAAELPEYKPHPEDVELDNEPTLFEQVMAANVDDSSDEEDEDDDDADATVDDSSNKPSSATGKKGVVVEDVDSDEDDDEDD